MSKEKNVNKEEMVNQLYGECSNAKIDLTKTDLSKIYNILMEIIKKGIVSKEGVRLHGIGTLSTVVRQARKCRNPQTGHLIDVPAKTGVKFSASSTLTDLLNE